MIEFRFDRLLTGFENHFIRSFFNSRADLFAVNNEIIAAKSEGRLNSVLYISRDKPPRGLIFIGLTEHQWD